MIGIARRVLDAMLLGEHGRALTHDVLHTFMCEVSAIINSRPIAQIAYDPDEPNVMTPAILLTQKTCQLSGLTTTENVREIYASQWKYVQVLSNTFWKRCKQGYLQSLQKRHKWQVEQENVRVGDIVILREQESHRNHWPLDVVGVYPSEDGKVRSVKVCVSKDGKNIMLRQTSD